MFIDTHCHLDDPSLSARLPEVMENARKAGVERFVIPGVSPGGWQGIASLADTDRGIYSAFGLHPMHADEFCRGMLDDLTVFARGGRAIGEIGLDYMLTAVSRERQIPAFRSQLELAVGMGIPVLIHCRRAFSDLLRVMKDARAEKVGGIMHAFSGSVETAMECIKLGFFISIAGPVTYGNAVRPVELAHRVALEHLVLETDSPDMAPVPFRGQANEPAFLLETARKVAAIKGVAVEEVAEVTTGNARRLLRI